MEFSLTKKLFAIYFFVSLLLIGGLVFVLGNNIAHFFESTFVACVGLIQNLKNIPPLVLVMYGALSLLIFSSVVNMVKYVVLEGWRSWRLYKMLLSASTRKDGFCIVQDEQAFALTIGYFRPSIFISTKLRDICSKGELVAVVLHETSHKKRKDPLRRFFWGAYKSFFFFIPIANELVKAVIENHEDIADLSLGEGIQRNEDLKNAIVKITRFQLGSCISECSLSNIIDRYKSRQDSKIKLVFSKLSIFFTVLIIVFAILMNRSVQAQEQHNEISHSANTSGFLNVSCASQSWPYSALQGVR